LECITFAVEKIENMKEHSFSNLSLAEVKLFIESHETAAFGFLNKNGKKVDAGPIIPKSFNLSINEAGDEMCVEYYTLKSKGDSIEVVDSKTPRTLNFKKTELFIGCVGTKDKDDFKLFKIEKQK
jgi:hypothetical protein